jgi:hypothetical protein
VVRHGPLVKGQTVVMGADPGSGGMRIEVPGKTLRPRELRFTRLASGKVVYQDLVHSDHVAEEFPVGNRLLMSIGTVRLTPDYCLWFVPKFRARRIPARLVTAHRTLVGGRQYRTQGIWRFFGTPPKPTIPWKLHIFADSPEDWLQAATVVLPYLQQASIHHKTVKSLSAIDRSLNGRRQSGKAFTAYFPSIPSLHRAARELHDLICTRGLARPDALIFGDHALGGSGRLFYRYDRDRRGRYRPNDGVPVPAFVDRDPLRALASSLACDQEPSTVHHG